MKIDWKSLVMIVAPLVLSNVKHGDKVPPDLIPTIVQGITEAQAIKGATGPEKKTHVEQLVKDAASALTSTGKIRIEGPALSAAVSSGIDDVVAAVKTIHGPAPKA